MSTPLTIGEAMFRADGQPGVPIATVFPDHRVIVTFGLTHIEQRNNYKDWLNRRRQAEGQAPISDEEEGALFVGAVDLILYERKVVIRPDTTQMERAFEADELLQECVDKSWIHFQDVLDPRVQEALKQRGEIWRMNAIPHEMRDIQTAIAASRTAFRGDAIYYYSPISGTRFLTCQMFAELGAKNDERLRLHLLEIRDFLAQSSVKKREIDFFEADGSIGGRDFRDPELESSDPARMRRAYDSLSRRFTEAVEAGMRVDDLENQLWCTRMFSALCADRNDVACEETQLGLSPEFYRQVRWLPGARIEHGELLFDQTEFHAFWKRKARGFITNFLREYGDLEYVNIGCVISSLSRTRPLKRGRRREVYVAVLKPRSSPELIQIIRRQKRCISDNLDGGSNLLDSILDAEGYTEYVLNRRLGCRQLGMNLAPRVIRRKLSEPYRGKRVEYRDQHIWTTYFQRDYIRGTATDKIRRERLTDSAFAIALARLLGAAAAPNLILGRGDPNAVGAITGEEGGLPDRVVFDDGDEVIFEDERGAPTDLVVTDHTGTFQHYLLDLEEYAAEYASPIARRILWGMSDWRPFADAYLREFVRKFVEIQGEYRAHLDAFRTLFDHLPTSEQENFNHRWKCVLDRLEKADPARLAELIEQAIPGRIPMEAERERMRRLKEQEEAERALAGDDEETGDREDDEEDE